MKKDVVPISFKEIVFIHDEVDMFPCTHIPLKSALICFHERTKGEKTV